MTILVVVLIAALFGVSVWLLFGEEHKNQQRHIRMVDVDRDIDGGSL